MKKNLLLAFSFAKRDFKVRYAGTGFGMFWYIISPIIMIFIYTVIFSDIMKMKLDIIVSDYSYSIYLVPGILAWTAFSSIIRRLSTSILDKANLIKKISVPIYTFYISIFIVETFIFFISMSLALLFLLIIKHPISEVFFILIPLMILQMVFGFFIGVIISLFVPFIKDLKEIVPIGLQLWFWGTPIVYLSTLIEKKHPLILKLNPFYYFIEIYHNIFLYSKFSSSYSIFVILILIFIFAFVTIYFYKKMVSTVKDII